MRKVETQRIRSSPLCANTSFVMKCCDFVSQHAVNLFLDPLRSVRICDDSVRIRTDTTLDQDCVLKATVQVCTACMIVSLLTTCLNLNTPPPAHVAPLSMQDSRVKRGTTGHKTQQARLPTDYGLYNSTFPTLVNCILTIPECRSYHHGRVHAQHRPDKASPLSHPRASMDC